MLILRRRRRRRRCRIDPYDVQPVVERGDDPRDYDWTCVGCKYCKDDSPGFHLKSGRIHLLLRTSRPVRVHTPPVVETGLLLVDRCHPWILLQHRRAVYLIELDDHRPIVSDHRKQPVR